MATSTSNGPADQRRAGPLLLAIASGLAHLVAGVFYLASGLMAPMWAILALLAWWLLLAWQLVRLARRASWWTPAVPVVAIATWFAVLTAGEELLGWTA